MKTLIAIGMIIGILLPVEINAQRDKAFGLKGGLNLAYLTHEEANENNILPGFHGGIWAAWRFSNHFSLRPEIIYSTRGTRKDYSSKLPGFDTANGATRVRQRYVDVPLYLTYYPVRNLKLHLGPYLGILVSADLDTQTEILEFIGVDNEEEIGWKDFHWWDIGFSGGIGFEFDPLLFGIMASMGIQQVAAEGGSLEILLTDAKNATFQIYLGVYF